MSTKKSRVLLVTKLGVSKDELLEMSTTSSRVVTRYLSNEDGTFSAVVQRTNLKTSYEDYRLLVSDKLGMVASVPITQLQYSSIGSLNIGSTEKHRCNIKGDNCQYVVDMYSIAGPTIVSVPEGNPTPEWITEYLDITDNKEEYSGVNFKKIFF